MFVMLGILVLSSLTVPTPAQQPGNMEQEEQPTVRLTECDRNGDCSTRQHKVTLDANWRWVHRQGNYDNCYTGNTWDTQICPDGRTCAQTCVLEGVTAAKYTETYGVEQIENGNGVKLNFVTEHQYGVNVGARLYMLDTDGEQYKMFFLKNREFAMEFDVSHAFCGMNGAMYFVEMDRQGGKGLNHNQAGAKYGTGYCDAQCPHDIKFIDGLANSEGWEPNPKDLSNNMGRGRYGSCCAEMDIWEANSMANAYTPHPCEVDGQLRCDGIQCGDNDKGERYSGVCDKDGCDINPFRMGNHTFFGRGEQFSVNTLKPMTVVTQFHTSDGTDSGPLVEMRRFYVQEGKVIHSPPTVILGDEATDSITDQFCADKKTLFGDVNDYHLKGGSQSMGDSLDRGHVMALSLWDDVEVNMLWLDSRYPLDKLADDPGVHRGDCPGGTTSTPSYVRSTYPDGYVTFTNAFVGPIGSFLNQPPTPPPTPAPCVSGCEPAPGQNQPECRGKDERVCKEWMSQQNKCNWAECPVSTPAPVPPTPVPTPAPPPSTPSPTPVPTPTLQCRMIPAAIPDNTRCEGDPLSGWGGLTQGRRVSESECREACLAEDSCLFAVWKAKRRKCSSFGVCSAPQRHRGFEVWTKDCPIEPPAPSPPTAGSPVGQHGRLRVAGNNIVGSHGDPVQLKGMSFFWSQWQGQYYTEGVVNWLADDWKCSLIRAALGIADSSGYLQDPGTEKAKVELVVNAAISKGIYVIIDWHDHHAENHVNQAKDFFDEMARKYGSYENVLFETYNEPLQVSWSGVIKPYHQQLVPVIRAHSDNVIILGTKTWSQDVDEAALDPVSGTNLAYTIHFYASTHKQSLRDKVISAKASGAAIVATEWGTCRADGDGNLDLGEANVWLDFLAYHGISYANWAVSDKQEACSALAPGASTSGGWSDEQLTASGRFMRGAIVATPVPTPDCQQWCRLAEVASCATLGEGSCELSFIHTDGVVFPCSWQSCGCFADGEGMMQCPQLDCSPLFLQEVSKHERDSGRAPRNNVAQQQPQQQRRLRSSRGFLSPIDNVVKGSAFVAQRKQMCSKLEALVEEEYETMLQTGQEEDTKAWS